MNPPGPRFPGHLLLGLLAIVSLASVTRAELPTPSVDLPVTNGLIRWWPNVFDVHDQITGQEGVVMGVLPPVETGAVDQTTFGHELVLLLLRPAITNQVFTICFWVRFEEEPAFSCLITQEGKDANWSFMTPAFGRSRFFISQLQNNEVEKGESVLLKLHEWHHVAIARRSPGTSLIWVDGSLVLDGRRINPWPADSRWLTVGSSLDGEGHESQFKGVLQDLCAFNRILSDGEILALYQHGVQARPALNTDARRRATSRPAAAQSKIEKVSPRPEAWIHKRFTTDDNLPANNVKAVLQAKSGYLWVGTEQGLARFDGRRFREFTTDNTPALKAIGHTVWSLSEDDDGTIWAGIFGGLLRIRGLEFVAFTNGLPQKFILQAVPVGDGSVWIAAFNASLPRGPMRLRRFNPESGVSSAETTVPGHIRRMVPDKGGLWIATEQPEKVYYWDGVSEAPQILAAIGKGGLMSLASNDVTKNAEIAVPAERSTSGYWGQIHFSNGPVFSWLWRARRTYAGRWAGSISVESWLGASYALSRLANGHVEHIEQPNQSASPEITSLCANREGGVWFGTDGDGLHLVQERLVRTFTTQDGLAGNDIRSLSQAPDGDIWATSDLGLSRYHSGHWETQGNSRDPLRSINVDAAGHPWFSRAESGQEALRKDNLTRKGNHVLLGLDWQDPNTLRFLSDGLWVVCERGVTWLRTNSLTLNGEGEWIPDATESKPGFGRFGIASHMSGFVPLGLVEDHDGFLWVGSHDGNGVVRLNRNGKVDIFSETNGVPGEKTVPVLCDTSGSLWLVSDVGVTRRKNGMFQTITAQDGLPRDNFLDMIEDDLGNFWISGKRGIHRINRADVERFFSGETNRLFSLTLGLRDGLLIPECSSLHYPTMSKSQDGHIWVATRHGVATFDPRKVSLDTQPVPVYVEQLLVRGRAVPGANESAGASRIHLPAGAGERLQFQFGAISFSAADRIQFSYRLDGCDSVWSAPSDERIAFYTNLRPGPYRFRVKAANAHGLWNERETVLAFAIAPFFWQTLLFQSCLAIAAIAGAGFLHARRLNAARSRQQTQHEQALVHEKTRIAADMHDELGATLTQIAILGEIAKTQTGNPTQTKSNLERISAAARQVTSGMSELVWATNPRNDTLENLVAYLREQAASQLMDSRVKANLDFPAEVPELHVSATFRRNLLLVVREMLHNAIKHSDATEAAITLRATSDTLFLTLKDNGKGFDMASSRHGNGIVNMQRRIVDLQGRLVMHSSPGHGVTAEIHLPLPARRPASFGI